MTIISFPTTRNSSAFAITNVPAKLKEHENRQVRGSDIRCRTRAIGMYRTSTRRIDETILSQSRVLTILTCEWQGDQCISKKFWSDPLVINPWIACLMTFFFNELKGW